MRPLRLRCPFPSALFPSLLLQLLLGGASAQNGNGPYAQGNLAVVFEPRTGRSPQPANVSALWCQATVNGQDRVLIQSARFVHLYPLPVRNHEARLSADGERAFLDFGEASVSAIGKYRCEITTKQGQLVVGNLFVHMRPILSVNATVRLDMADEKNPFAWIGSSNKVSMGETAALHCPAVGYPRPRIVWFKDGMPINLSAIVEEEEQIGADDEALPRLKYLIGGDTLRIRAATESDEGIYKCVASNQFEPSVDSRNQEYQLTLEQHLRVSNSLSWLPPLLVIIVCLILLVLIIYGCSAWKRYKYRQYNVAQKERELGHEGAMPESHKLPMEPEEGEE